MKDWQGPNWKFPDRHHDDFMWVYKPDVLMSTSPYVLERSWSKGVIDWVKVFSSRRVVL